MYGGIVGECEGKTDQSHKGRALEWVRIFIWPSGCGRYIRTYVIHASACTCAPETRSVRTARGCGEEGVPPLPFESIITVLAGRRRANGRYISGLAFMWRPTVELIFTRFGVDPLLPSSFSSFVSYPRSEHASTTSRNSRFQPRSPSSLTPEAGCLVVTTPLRISSHAKFSMLC